ncbi:MAG: RAD55 family ATPase, partial [Gemmatimonadota bacterium]
RARGCPHRRCHSGATSERRRRRAGRQPASGAVLDALDLLSDGPWTGNGNQRVLPRTAAVPGPAASADRLPHGRAGCPGGPGRRRLAGRDAAPYPERRRRHGAPAARKGVTVGAAPASRPIEATGVPGLDAVLGGGLRRGALVLVVGPPGSGKTTLAAQLAFAAAAAGRRAALLTALSESTDKLVDHLRTLAFFDAGAVGDALQVLSLQQFLADGLAGAADAVVAAARQQRADLVVLDGYQGARGAGGDAQLGRQFLYDVGGRLNLLGATLVVTSTTPPPPPRSWRRPRPPTRSSSSPPPSSGSASGGRWGWSRCAGRRPCRGCTG